ncbi:MAG: hypothetical protein V1861_03960 [Candidatus Micrarchaeota archaeon]
MPKSTLLPSIFILLIVSVLIYAQDEDREEDSEQSLRMENWVLKQCLFNPGAHKLKGSEHTHKNVFGFTAIPASRDVSSSIGLGEGEGLVVESVEHECAKTSDIAKGDVIARHMSVKGKWVNATTRSINDEYLPGDSIRMEIFRGSRRINAETWITCQCGRGISCPYKSPFAEKAASGDLITRNESSAIGTLKAISAGEEMFRTASCVDCNNNGIGEYGFLTELSGRRNCRHSDINVSNSPYIAHLLGDVDEIGRAMRRGYYFILYLPGYSKTLSDGNISEGPADLQEESYVCYAFPVRPGITGKRVFAISPMGTVLCLLNKNLKWGADCIPPAGLCCKDGIDISSASSQFVNVGEKGGSDEAWVSEHTQLDSASEEDLIKMYRGALDAWGRDFKAANPDKRMRVDFMTYLNDASKKLGAKDWSDFVIQYAQLLGVEKLNKIIKELVDYQIEYMKKLQKEIENEGKGK